MKPKILIVDDEVQMRILLNIHLKNDFEIIEASNGIDTLEKVKREAINLVLLDIMMPFLDGKETCQKIRELKPELPVILLTALNDTKDKVEGLNLGADDYIVKPFDPEELIARIKAHLRRVMKENRQSYNAVIKIGELSLFPKSREVFVNEQPLKLTPKEFDLLHLLVANINIVFSRDQLLDQIWGINDISDIRTVDSHVRYIRDKLKNAGLHGQLIQTVWGIGYKVSEGVKR